VEDMQITVRKDDLLKKLRENRDKHHTVFQASLRGYSEHCHEILAAHIRAIDSGRTPEIRITVARPEDHTRDYDRVIGMLEMHQGDTFALDEVMYAQYVDDDWGWKRQWLKLSSEYAAGATIANYGRQA